MLESALPGCFESALELQELRALAVYRERQASGGKADLPHDEAYHRVFGDDA
ncbi:hypothetical protein [Streptomyces uncialis]|uniref:hypothetical protein n=1 Tax=Streptomyces uncialis TaxID=1048205 RepID=UPI00386A432E|nr:hypothetical protein OG924_29110 [Streptomyces uncialis]